jgi:hypothetical protein
MPLSPSKILERGLFAAAVLSLCASGRAPSAKTPAVEIVRFFDRHLGR